MATLCAKMLRFDRGLFFLLVMAIGIMSLVNLYSSSYEMAIGGQPFFRKQLYFFGLGILLIFCINAFDYRLLHKLNYPMYTASILLLVIVLFWGDQIAKTSRWLDLGFFRLQPSEPVKLLLVVTLASHFSRRDTGDGFSFRQLLVPLALTGLPFILIMQQPDLGTALMLWGVFFSMSLFLTIRLSMVSILSLLGGGLGSLPLAWFFLLRPYQRTRIVDWVHGLWNWIKGISSDGVERTMDSGYHITQSTIAIGSGKFWGKGWLVGTQSHLHFLPEQHTDFAFSVWAEEWGFVGSVVFLAVYFIMIYRGLKIGLATKDSFGRLLIMGIIALIFWQAVINLLMVMGGLPVVGIPLPLFSYGGSSLITTMAGIGIIFSVISHQ